MTLHNTVVPKKEPLTEEEFGATMRMMLNRLIREHTKPQVALWLGVTVRHLSGNILGGSALPSPDKLWNLLLKDETAHDELDAEFGFVTLRRQEDDSTAEPMTVTMIGLAKETAEAEAGHSAAGMSVTDGELRKMDEATIRKVHRTTGAWIARLDAMRRPRAVEAVS